MTPIKPGSAYGFTGRFLVAAMVTVRSGSGDVVRTHRGIMEFGEALHVARGFLRNGVPDARVFEWRPGECRLVAVLTELACGGA